MSNAHTPAPWVLKISSGMVENIEHTIAEIGTTGSYRGAVTRLQSAEHIYGIGKDELIANARLIAAAPDLLEALKLLLSSAHDYQSGITEARAAIAKAEGRT